MEQLSDKLRNEYTKAMNNLAVAAERIDATKGVAKTNAKMDFLMAQMNMLSVQLMIIDERTKGIGEKGHVFASAKPIRDEFLDKVKDREGEFNCVHCGRTLTMDNIHSDGVHCPDCGLIFGCDEAIGYRPEFILRAYKIEADKKQFPMYWPLRKREEVKK